MRRKQRSLNAQRRIAASSTNWFLQFSSPFFLNFNLGFKLKQKYLRFSLICQMSSFLKNYYFIILQVEIWISKFFQQLSSGRKWCLVKKKFSFYYFWRVRYLLILAPCIIFCCAKVVRSASMLVLPCIFQTVDLKRCIVPLLLGSSLWSIANSQK